MKVASPPLPPADAPAVICVLPPLVLDADPAVKVRAPPRLASSVEPTVNVIGPATPLVASPLVILTAPELPDVVSCVANVMTPLFVPPKPADMVKAPPSAVEDAPDVI